MSSTFELRHIKWIPCSCSRLFSPRVC